MKTVGIILKEARLARGIKLSDVEEATKIRRKFLEAIEEDEYQSLPSLSYAKGFVKNYSEYLGLDSRNVLAFFRRQTNEISKSSLLPKGVEAPLNASGFHLTPGRFLAMVALTLAGLFFVYLGTQYRKLHTPPSLTIESPRDKTVTTQRQLDVLGKTDPDATVTVNGSSVLVRSDGKFFAQMLLEIGPNQLTVITTSRFGKTTTLSEEITRQSE